MLAPNDDPTIQLSYTPYTLKFDPEAQTGIASARKKWERPRLDQLVANIPLWNKIIVFSCVIAVSLDPLFFYIPYIDKKNMCLGKDKKLKDVSIVLRVLTDITIILHMIYQIREAIKTVNSKVQTLKMSGCESKAKAVARKLPWISLVTDFLAVLPIPQVLLVSVFFKMKGSGYLNKRKVVSFFIFAQYLPRIYRIHLSSKKLTRTGIWVKGAFNFFLYILSSHVLGAYWYFFSIQRETACWHHACVQHDGGCMDTLYCDEPTPIPRNKTFFEEYCSINDTRNATEQFDFGIFLDSLKSGNTASLDFPMKFFYSFWWGLRNLSNFGTNLITSTYVWENCFAILISMIGLLLFVYLIGNVQTLLQLATTKSEEIKRKMKMKVRNIEDWMVKNDLPEDMKKEIKKNIKQKLKENIDADLENIFSILPWHTKKSLKRFLCMSTLRKVPMLKEMDEKVLKMICDYLRPVMYAENSVIVRMGGPLDRMLLITEGFIWTYTDGDQSQNGGGSSRARTSKSGSTSSMATHMLKKGEIYGEELLNWALSPSELPISAQTVHCHTKIEAFVLMAKDLRSVVSKCGFWWDPNNRNNNNTNTHHEQPLLAGVESSTARIRYIKPAVHPH